MKRISLEDILTCIDRASSSKEVLQSYDEIALGEVRHALIDCMLQVFETRWAQANLDPMAHWAGHLVLRRLEAGQEADPFAVISTNWDLSLDVMLEVWSRLAGSIHEKDGWKGPRVDYCTYTYPIHPENSHPPCISLKARGYYNVKLIKPHGSFNWLTCPSCRRLFITNRDKSPNLVNVPKLRRREHCHVCASRPLLKPLIVTPTYLKDLNNAHLQSVWQNALIELTEANRVVFCGYSFPESDFELRYLMARGVRTDADVKVYLHSPTRRLTSKAKSAKDRYTAFFGPERCSVSFRGFAGLLADEAASSRTTFRKLLKFRAPR